MLCFTSSIVFALIFGNVYEHRGTNHVLITTSFKSDEQVGSVGFDFKSKSDSIQTQMPLGNTDVQFITGFFPKTDHIEGLSLSFPFKRNTRIFSLSIVANGFQKVYEPKEMLKYFDVSGASAQAIDDYLELNSLGSADHFTLTLSNSLDLKKRRYNWSVVVGVFFIMLVLTSLVLSASKNHNRPGGVWGGAAITTAIVVLILNSIKDDASNIDIEVFASKTAYEGQQFEMFLSKLPSFSTERMLSVKANPESEITADFQLPAGVYSYFRLDFPDNESVVLDEIKLRHGPFSYSLKGHEILEVFRMRHDVTLSMSQDGKVNVVGGNDPFIVTSNEAFQNKLHFIQAKKKRYPFFFGVIIFLTAIFIFQRVRLSANAVFAVVLCISLLIPLLIMTVKEDALVMTGEKRVAFQLPKGITGLRDFVLKTELYIGDQFGGRGRMITYWNVLQTVLFEETGGKSPVLMGEEGWMFYRSEGVLELYEQKEKFSPEELERIRVNLEARRDWLALYGIEYYMVVPPLKHTIYPDKYPTDIRQYPGPSKMDQVMSYLKDSTSLNVVDLRPSMRKARTKESKDVYYKVDSHWNLLGAFYGYDSLMTVLRKDFENISDPLPYDKMNWTESQSFDGDLAMLMAMQKHFPRQEILPNPEGGFKSQFVNSLSYPTYSSPHAVITKETSDTTQLKLIMNRDSYANFLIPYLSEHFSRSVYLWTPYFNAEIVKQEMPDIMITEVMERFLVDLMLDNPDIVSKELENADQSSTSD